MDAFTLKDLYIKFFTSHGHKEISGASLIPQNDPTVLFTTAGMHPLVSYILGQPHPEGKRLTNVQGCVRTGDIDSIGDETHLTFFEMLGNWSLGDYFKEDAIKMSWELLTSKDFLALDPSRLYITVFGGGDGLPEDSAAPRAWLEAGLEESHLVRRSKKHNWWGPAGLTGPCGPDTEMFYDSRPDLPEGKIDDGDRYFEIWNNVFMEYFKAEDGSLAPLKMRCVDAGMGLERTTAILEGKSSVYDIELFTPLLSLIEKSSSAQGLRESERLRLSRIIADHMRTATMIIGDPEGALPSNLGQGYVLRRLIRKSVRAARLLGADLNLLSGLVDTVVGQYGRYYPSLKAGREQIIKVVSDEAELFAKTLEQGTREFEKISRKLKEAGSSLIDGPAAFRLYDTFGFPLEMTKDFAAEHGMSVDEPGFNAAEKAHKELSKAALDKGSFKGGLADHSWKSTQYHTATHLLHAALRRVLGPEVAQKGSNSTPERLRFDFSYSDKMTPEQIKEVEDLVNSAISQDLPVMMEMTSLEEAKGRGAMALFESKYGEKVKLYKIGDFSLEVCGGPHVEHLGQLGHFKIVKEQSSSKGVRRIRAVLEGGEERD